MKKIFSLSFGLFQLSMVGLITASLTGCTTNNPYVWGKGTCDETGCQTCLDNGTRCWPLDNQRCDNSTQCPSGKSCTTVGCATACKTDQDCVESELCITGWCSGALFEEIKPHEERVAAKTDAGQIAMNNNSPAKSDAGLSTNNPKSDASLPANNSTLPSSCATDSQCGPSNHCDQGKCVANCKSDDQCASGQVCAPCGKCQAATAPAVCGATINWCGVDMDCGSLKKCLSGKCHYRCSLSSQCSVGQVCASNVCIDDPSPVHPQCRLNSECSNGLCINGFCHNRCETTTQCGAKMVCMLEVCQPDYSPALN